MVLNLTDETGLVLLGLVNAEAERLLAELASMTPHERALAQKRLQHLGVAKHRLEANLWLPDPFPGPAAWGLPRRPAAEPDGPATGDMFEPAKRKG